MAWLANDKETTQKLLREFIIQLCRLNVDNSGCYEVDGIICITRGNSLGNGSTESSDEDQIVVKVHEQVNVDIPVSNSVPLNTSTSVLKEYLSCHVNQAICSMDRYDMSRNMPPLNLKRKANDENDNAIIDVGRHAVMGSDILSNLKLNKRANTASSCSPYERDIQVNNSISGCMPRDLTKNISKTSTDDSENSGSDVQCCGSCLLDFDSTEALKHHFQLMHSSTLDHYCSLCAVGFINATDLARHNSAVHNQQSMTSRRRKQVKPRRGLVVDTVDVDNDEMGEDNDAGSKSSDTPPSDGEIIPVTYLLQKQMLPKASDTCVIPEAAKLMLDMNAEMNCPHCSLAFPDFQVFNVHCQSVHQRFPCPCCLQTFTQRVNRDRHLYNHTGKKPHVCQVCGGSFTRKDALKKHQMKAGHQVGGAENSTDELVTVSSLPQFDLSEDSTEEEEISQNEECGLDLSLGGDGAGRGTKEISVDDIKTREDDGPVNSNHRNSENDTSNISNSDKKPFPFPLVSPVEMLDNDLSSSVLLKVNTPSSRSSSKSSSLAKTRILFADQNRTYCCDICRVSVFGAADFELHCRTYHRRTPCIYCGKTFSQKGNMERHQRQHTGERPFACPFCSCSYTRKETLKVHINQAHAAASSSSSNAVAAAAAIVVSAPAVASPSVVTASGTAVLSGLSM